MRCKVHPELYLPTIPNPQEIDWPNYWDDHRVCCGRPLDMLWYWGEPLVWCGWPLGVRWCWRCQSLVDLFLVVKTVRARCKWQSIKSRERKQFIYKPLLTPVDAKVAFLLDNPVLDVGNPDCLDIHVSWNKNPKNDRSVPFHDHPQAPLFLFCLLFVR